MTAARRHSGFTLLEMSIVVAIIAIIVAMGFSTGKGVIEAGERGSTNRKLDQLEAALMEFRTVNNRLPCPADATLLESDPNYGVEGVNGGACTTGSTYISNGVRTVQANPGPTANYVDTINNVVEGAVPFKALNLPKEFMYDGWGRKFAYAVNYNVTGTLSMLGENLTDSCQISVNDASESNPAARTTGAIYTLVSYGEDGHGGYLKTGARLNAGSTNVDELANCHCDDTATETTYSLNPPTSTPAGQPYVQHDFTQDPTTSTNMFGDIVRFKEPWQMATYDSQNASNGGMTCAKGFRIDGVEDSETTLAGVGDVNGDGIADMLFVGNGGVYVVFGTKNGFPDPLELSNLNGTNGFYVANACTGPQTGAASLGDVNGDGYQDIITYASWAGNPPGNYGCGMIIFGGPGPWTSYNNANGSALVSAGQAVSISQPDPGTNGYSIAAGDINGDGVDDIIYGFTGENNGTTGQVSLLFGHTGTWPSSNTYSTGGFNGTTGVMYTGNGIPSGGGYDCFGISVAAADVNGDGIKDLILSDGCNGGYGNGSIEAEVDVIFGKRAGWPSTPTQASTLMDGQNGYQIISGNPMFGISVATGDFNGDGIQDIVTSEPYAGNNVELIFGQKCGNAWGTTCEWGTPPAPGPLWEGWWMGSPYASLNGALLFDDHWVGMNNGGGMAAVAGGDVNGDGIDDVIIGEPGTNNAYEAGEGSGCNGGGAVLVEFGMHNWPGALTVTASNQGSSGTQNGLNGIEVDGDAANDCLGFSVAAADVNGDGIKDILASTPSGTMNGLFRSGDTYVIWGRKHGWWTTPLSADQL